jgi:hypothetical protein
MSIQITIPTGPAPLFLGALAMIGVGMIAAPSPGFQDTTVPQGQVLQVPYGATSDSNSQMIAVTGVDRTGASVLYLVDTQAKQLAVYQASGGTSSSTGLKLIGARRLDLDLQLFGYNDKSEHSYRDLEKQFSQNTAGK